MRTSVGRIVDRRAVFAAIAACVVFGILPLVVGAALSFCSVAPNGSLRFGSFDAYTSVIAGGRVHEYARILQRALLAMLCTMVLALPAAYVIARLHSVAVKKLVVGAMIAPWLISDMLRAFGWQLLLSPSGAISKLWIAVTGGAPLEGLRYNWLAVTIGLVSASLPAGVLSVLAALPEHDDEEWLAASEFGRPRHVLALIGFGRARPGIVVGMCAVFVLSCFASAEARFLDGPTQSSIQTVTSSLVNDGVPALLAFGSLLTVATLLVCLGAFAISDKFSARRNDQPPAGIIQAPLHARRRPWRGIGATVDAGVRILPPLAVGVVLLLSLAPVAAVAIEAFREPTSVGPMWTLRNFSRMATSSILRDALTNSFQIALVAALIAVVVGFLLSLTTWDRTIRKWVLLLLAVLALLPGDAYAVSLYQLAKLFGHREGGALLVVVAHALWAIPFATGTLLLANISIRTDVLEAGLEYAHGPVDVLIRVIGRMNAGKAAAVGILAATLSLNEYVRASYLGGGVLTLSSEVYARLNAGLLPENRGVFAAALLMFLLSLASTILTMRLIRIPGSRTKSGD